MNKAEIKENGKNSGVWQVFFGFISKNGFQLDHFCSSKMYKSFNSANKAKKTWESK